jgi:hypothetical protein
MSSSVHRTEILPSFAGADWTAADDVAFSSGILTLDEPSTPLYFNTRYWSPNDPNTDGNGDRRLSRDVTYYALNNLEPWALGDYTFSTYIKFIGGAAGSHPSFKQHYNPIVTTDYLDAKMYFAGGTSMRLYIVQNDGVTRVMDTNYSSIVYSWPQSAWKRLEIQVVGNTIQFSIYDDSTDTLIMRCTSDNLDMDATDLGTCTMGYVSGWNERWIVGGGAAGTRDWPRIYEPKSGTATLKEGSAITLRSTFLAFDRLYYSYDTTNDANEHQRGQVSFRIMIYDQATATWGSWQNIGVDGDLSGISANPGDKYRLEASLANEADVHTGRLMTYPGIKELAMTCTAGFTSATLQMDDLLALIKDEIDGDATIAAHPGFKTGTGSIICDGNYFPPMPAGWATVYLARGATDRPSPGQGRDGAEARATHRITHNFQAIPCVVYETSDPAKKLMATNALEQLTTMVIEALSCNNLAGNLNRTQQMIIGDVTPGPHSIENNVYYSANTIDITVLVGSDKS